MARNRAKSPLPTAAPWAARGLQRSAFHEATQLTAARSADRARHLAGMSVHAGTPGTAREGARTTAMPACVPFDWFLLNERLEGPMCVMVLNNPIAPIGAALLLLLAAGTSRLGDLFVLRLDEQWAELILSKAAALALVLGFAATAGAGMAGLGLRSRGAPVHGSRAAEAAVDQGPLPEDDLRVR